MKRFGQDYLIEGTIVEKSSLLPCEQLKKDLKRKEIHNTYKKVKRRLTLAD